MKRRSANRQNVVLKGVVWILVTGMLVACSEERNRVQVLILKERRVLFSSFILIPSSFSAEQIWKQINDHVEFTPVSADPYFEKEQPYRKPYDVTLQGDLSIAVVDAEDNLLTHEFWSRIRLKPNHDGSIWKLDATIPKKSLEESFRLPDSDQDEEDGEENAEKVGDPENEKENPEPINADQIE